MGGCLSVLLGAGRFWQPRKNLDTEGESVKIDYTYLEEPKQPSGPDNEWINRRMDFSINGNLEKLRAMISNGTGISRNHLRLSYKTSQENTNKWFLLEDENDFEKMMIDGDEVVEIKVMHKQSKKDKQVIIVEDPDQTNSILSQANKAQASTSTNDDQTLLYSLPAANSSGYEYDVFISFRGEDTRKGFVGHLYSALNQYGIHTFIDERELKKGHKIDEIFVAIEKSAIFVPVFSKAYAESKWCLKEIHNIVKCKRLMLPIFYDIEPTDVRNQTGPFEEAFAKHADNDKIKAESVVCWRQALTEASAVSSYVLQNDYNGREVDLINAVVKQILKETKKDDRFEVAEHPVGVDFHVANVLKILNSRPDHKEVLMVGIVGMGGLGKTTIARLLFIQLSAQFDGSCLLLNTKDEWIQPRGQDSLKQKLLSDILKVDIVDTSGDYVIKQRLQNKKVLLILDGVDKKEQLEVLAGNFNWFGDGSRIIVTTRDRSLLNKHQFVREDEIYRPKPLTDSQSLQLFSVHAFRTNEPPGKFLNLSKRFVATTGGLPLSIKVLGSELLCHTDERKWEEMLLKYKKYPHRDIQQRLRSSFDQLDDHQQSIFLDIACSDRIKQSLQYATYMWEAQGFSPGHSLAVLEYKSLITIDREANIISMHCQLVELGRAIAREEPRKKSRLWDAKEIDDQLEAHIDKIEVMDTVNCKRRRSVQADMRSMSKLRMLHMDGTHALDCQSPSSIHLPTSLQWLEWTDLPRNVFIAELKNLVVLELEDPTGEHPIEIKDPDFPKLKSLILKRNLFVVGRFDGMTCLEKLVMRDAYGLDEIHESIGRLKQIEIFKVTEAYEIKELPEELGSMESLKHFDLSGCKGVSAIPCSIGNLKKLESLKVRGFKQLIELPDSIRSLENLQILDASYCEVLCIVPPLPSSLTSLTCRGCYAVETLPEMSNLMSLRTLDLHSCFKMLCTIPSLPSSLEYLNCGGCSALETLPEMSSLMNLEELCLSSCTTLRALPPLPSSLTSLECQGCHAIETLPELSNMINLRKLNLHSCFKMLRTLPPLPSSLEYLNCGGCTVLQTLPEMSNLMNLWWLDLSSCSKMLCALPPLPSSLEYLNCSQCNVLRTLPNMSNLMKLRELNLDHCQMLRVLPHLPSSLTSLSCRECYVLESLPKLSNLTNLRRLDLHHCFEMLSTLPSLPSSLEYLNCSECVVLRSLPDMSNLMNLRELNLDSCFVLQTLPPLPSSLTLLGCRDCSVLETFPEMSNLMNLARLDLHHCFKTLRVLPPLPSSLEYLNCSQCDVLQTLQDMSNLTSLRELNLNHCQMLRALPPLPTSLTSLSCRDCGVLESLPELSNLTNLTRLDLHQCFKMLCALPPLPSSLEYLNCAQCHVLQSLPEMSNLMNLRELILDSCFKLRDLPPSLPSSLSSLHLRECHDLGALPEMSTLMNLTRLDLYNCCARLHTVPPLPSCLEYLNCELCNNLETLPDMSNLMNFRELIVNHCWKLRSLPPLPPSLILLSVRSCGALPATSASLDYLNRTFGGFKNLNTYWP